MKSNDPEPPADPNADVGRAARKIKDQAANLASAAGKKLSQLRDRVGSAAEDLRDKVGEKVTDLRHGAVDLYERATARVRTIGEDGVEFVRKNPVSTVLTVFAAGFLLGRFMRR